MRSTLPLRAGAALFAIACMVFTPGCRTQVRTTHYLAVFDPVEQVPQDVEAYANANYVVMRDHLGNWQVKAAKNDPTELINAAYGGTLAALHVLSQPGSTSSVVKRHFDELYGQEKAGKTHPLGLDTLVQELEKEHEAATQEKDAEIAKVDEELKEVAAQRGADPPPDEEAKKELEQKQADARAEKEELLREKLAIHRELVEDLTRIQKALVAPTVEEPES